MPSPTLRRNFIPQAYYHVFNRGNNKQPIFFQEKDYWIFRRYLKEALRRFPGVRIVVFALLENHFHLLLYQENKNDISRFMRSFVIRYARYIKEKYRREGKLFGSSFHAIYLHDSSEVDRESRYIFHNPINAGLIHWKHVGARL